jgi:hypothetical protein
MKIKIVVGSIEAFATLCNTRTAAAVVNSLPFDSVAHSWGEEIYFEVPLELELENGKVVLEIGEIAYWSPGKSMCIFFGPTLSSRGHEIRAYSAVSVFGKITGDAGVFRAMREGERIRVEVAD